MVPQRESGCYYHLKGKEMLIRQNDLSTLPMTYKSLHDLDHCQSLPSLIFLSITGLLIDSWMCQFVSDLSAFASAIFSAWNVWQAKFYSSLQLQLKYLLLWEPFADFQLVRWLFPLLCHYYTYYLPTLLCFFSPYAAIIHFFVCLAQQPGRVLLDPWNIEQMQSRCSINYCIVLCE